MRYTEIILEDAQVDKGTYVGVRFDEESCNLLSTIQEQCDIPNPLPKEMFHSTIVYSKVSIPWECQPCDIEAHGLLWEVWDTQGGNRCLVLKLDCPYMVERFNTARALGATFDYDEYTPHVTLSYNVGDFDVSNLPNPKIAIRIVEEYQNIIQEDWA